MKHQAVSGQWQRKYLQRLSLYTHAKYAGIYFRVRPKEKTIALTKNKNKNIITAHPAEKRVASNRSSPQQFVTATDHHSQRLIEEFDRFFFTFFTSSDARNAASWKKLAGGTAKSCGHRSASSLKCRVWSPSARRTCSSQSGVSSLNQGWYNSCWEPVHDNQRFQPEVSCIPGTC